MKKIILAASILLLATACNKAQPVNNQQSTNTQSQINLTQTYINSKANYTYKFPAGYVVESGSADEAPALATASAIGTGVVRQSDNVEVFQINAISITSFTLQSITDYVKKEMPSVSNDIAVSEVKVNNMIAYKAVDGVTSDGIPSDRYYVQNSKGAIFEILVVKAEPVSLQIFNSFSFTK